MKLGVYTAILHDKPLNEALDVIASLGLTGAEINAGGFLPTPHLPVDDLLSGVTSPREYLANFDGTGVEIAGLNCNGNPLHPDPEVGPEDADDLRNAIRVARLLGVDRVVTMSGLPEAHPDQANLVQNAVDSKVNALAVTLARPEALKAAVQSATAAGIPVVAFNAGINDWPHLRDRPRDRGAVGCRCN